MNYYALNQSMVGQIPGFINPVVHLAPELLGCFIKTVDSRVLAQTWENPHFLYKSLICAF